MLLTSFPLRNTNQFFVTGNQIHLGYNPVTTVGVAAPARMCLNTYYCLVRLGVVSRGSVCDTCQLTWVCV